MNTAYYRKFIMKQGKFEEVIAYPYFTNELKSYAHVIAISSNVIAVEDVTHRNKVLATVVPFIGSVENSLRIHRDEVLKRMNVDAPVFSIYNMKEEKLFELQANK